MNLSISNISWSKEKDLMVYEAMRNNGFSGLEIAPNRIVFENPYGHIDVVKSWKNDTAFIVPSMQSIWFGRQEKIFGTTEERQFLIDYTKKAIEFSEAIDCRNLVFGCPRNRNLPDEADSSIAIAFFKELGDYAAEHNTVIGMEANPPIYNTNYINSTKDALELIEQVNSSGFRLNLDVGTMIYNDEAVEELSGKVHLINHVHISEPGLKLIERRKLHQELKELLEAENYQGYVSIEMGKREDVSEIEQALKYVKEIFG